MTDSDKLRDYLERVTLDLRKTRRRLRSVEERASEPIAIVGMSCRFPGGVSSPEEMWRLLADGRDAIADFPSDRGWDVQSIYSPDPEVAGTSYACEGGFLDAVADFDPDFFGISPREALAMDPQQRLFLEACWEAFEDAAIDPGSQRGQRTGVFAGAMHQPYGESSQELTESVEAYLGTGVSTSVLSGRVAYTFGLEGPAVTIDTACSSSLVALHLACQSLRTGECSLALAGGVAVLSTPGVFVEFARQRGLARDGRCKSYSDAADGTGFSEGVGVLAVERLSDALRRGRRVLAVVRGSAVNQDGASNGLTAPNGPSQERVISQALANAGLSTGDVDAVEGHGTGTVLGDPIEARALLATYGRERNGSGPLWLGSIKSNIGHAQAAAGVAGVIKMVKALQHGRLPRTLHLGEPSSHVEWEAGSVSLLSEEQPWGAGERPRRAGVSSFGISGTNAHVILEEPPAPQAQGPRAPLEALPAVPLVLSGHGAGGLAGQAQRLLALLAEAETDTGDVGLSLLDRSELSERAVVVGSERRALIAGLRGLADGEARGGVAWGTARAAGLGVLFTGQGAQRVGMGRELHAAFPVFREAFDAACEQLDGLLGCSLREVVFDGADGGLGGLDETVLAQPGLFALEVALFALVESWGVKPDYLLGHSIGEIVAAHVSGVLSLQDACKLVAARGKLMGALPTGGAMASIAAGEQQVADSLAGYEGRAGIAAVNGPSSIVVSGERDAIEELVGLWSAREVKTKRLRVSHAFHSHRMDPMLDEFRRTLQTLTFSEPTIQIVSNLTGELADAEQLCSVDYWVRHVREPVRFVQGMRTLIGRGVGDYLELGPDGVLAGMGQQCVEHEQEHGATTVPDGVLVAALRGERPEAETLLGAVGQIWARGASVDWSEVFAGRGYERVPLPTYAFQRERYWLSSGRGNGDVGSIGLTSAGHPLLGAVVSLAGGDNWVLTGRLSLQSDPWLADHAVMGATLFPGTGLLELALHAGELAGTPKVRELVLESPLVLAAEGGTQVQVVVGELGEDGARTIGIHSRPESRQEDEQAGWTRHAEGVLAGAEEHPETGSALAGAWPPEGAEEVEIEDLYGGLADIGLDYGPVFQGLQRVWRGPEALYAEVGLPDEQTERAASFGLHPALLDAALHTAFAGAGEDRPAVRLPFSWRDVSLGAVGAASLRVELSLGTDGAIRLATADETGTPVLSAGSLATREISPEQLKSGDAEESLLELRWTPLTGGGAKATAGADAMHAAHAADGADALDAADAVDGAEDTSRDWTILGEGELMRALPGAECHPDLTSLQAIQDGDPKTVLVDVDALFASSSSTDVLEGAHAGLARLLGVLQAWLADEQRSEGRQLVAVTRRAVTTHPADGLGNFAQSAAWGLMRSAQSEHPERFVLIDLDDSPAAGSEGELAELLDRALLSEEPQLALRHGELLTPRLMRSVSASETLSIPEGVQEWCLQAGAGGSFDELALEPAPAAGAPLGPLEVRVDVRAAGLNFRDVLMALGMYPGEAVLGTEGAGVIVEVGSDVEGLTIGDRVMGLLGRGFGPVSVTDHRLLARVPDDWSFEQAASVPVAFMTAYFGLVDLGGLKSGESVLIHAAAGGVGMAAVQIARHLGAEVFGTASPSKWGRLRSLGLEDSHIGSSRTVEFRRRFLEQTDGRGVDVVLDSLSGELVDATLEVLPRGGRFLEMGKTDMRDPQTVAAEHPGVAYRAFDLIEAGPERISSMLAEIVSLFQDGVFEALPRISWDLRRAPEAFRFMSQARHTGKIVLTVPRTDGGLDGHGGLDGRSVLVTGGTGGLGALVARHLVAERGVRSLVLTSRRGLDAPGAVELRDELAGAGARVEVLACDVSDRDALKALVEAVPRELPLGGVVHAAGVVDDGVIDSLTGESIERVMGPKADAAWHLHELTEGLDLAFFTLFSSAAACLGAPGQGNYAAANAFLDGLAAYRRAKGLAGTSIGWGYWDQVSEMTGALEEADLARMSRAGVLPLSVEEGLRLLDVAQASPEAMVVAMRLDPAALRAQARSGLLPSLLSGLVRVPVRRAAGGGSLARRLAGVAEGERENVVLDLVRGEVAVVLGHSSAGSIDPDRAFKDLGFDSLAAVELRNRLNSIAGMRLPATLVFDYPSSNLLARHLLEQVGGADEQQRQPTAARKTNSEELVAIVGMSCRYPGGVRSPEDLWRMVLEGRDGIGGFPSNRGWELESLFDPDPDNPGTSYVREGGFLYDAGDFDAGFFGISPREALAMDPQQRLLLEASWEALEDAELDPATLRGTQTGVFAGISSIDYGQADSLGGMEGYGPTGLLASVASGRISYVFGLEGPAVTVDTACSSSLVALHLACQGLRTGECSLALASGTTVLATPGLFLGFSRQRGLALDGRCKSFAEAADGAGFAEGVGVLVLERLSDALQNGHRVMGVVRGSAVNQDGASNGLTAPNGPSQQRVIMQALASAGLGTEEVDAVEAHGTGTVLGDPIEAQALLATYGRERDGEPLWLGSVKSNIGHTQAAAGVAGVIKMVKALEHGMLPPTLHVDEPSRNVDWSEGAVSLLREPQAWERNGRARRAGISSFGVSGTNAHVIVEEPPAGGDSGRRAEEAALGAEEAAPAGAVTEAGVRAEAVTGAESGARVVGDGVSSFAWVLSGRGPDGLRGQAERLLGFVNGGSPAGEGDIGLSLSARPAFADRAVIVGDRDELCGGLDALAQSTSAAGPIEGSVLEGADGGAVFVFPGQGSQWEGMSVALLEESPAFAARLRECDEALSRYVGWSVEAVLRGQEGAPGLERVDVVQPVLFAVMVSLAGLWRACGVRPSAVVGHSQGEIAAAVVAGGLSLDDGARVVAARSRVLSVDLSGKGGMLSLAIGLEEASSRVARWDGVISVAAVNGPGSVVASGDSDALRELLSECEGEGIRGRLIEVDYAAHSAQIEAVRDELLDGCAGIEPRSGEVPFYSAVTGGLLDTAGLDPEYWYRNLRETVRFDQVTRVLLEEGRRVFVETSPHPVLAIGVGETAEQALGSSDGVLASGSLRRGEGGIERFQRSLGEAWVRGVDVDWARLFEGRDSRRVPLPSYAFQRERYWLTAGAGSGNVSSAGLSAADHPLLGAMVGLAGGDGLVFTGRISAQQQPWLADHAVMGTVLCPGTGFLELALHAGAAAGVPACRELVLEAPLVLGEAAVRIQVVVGEQSEDGSRTVRIYSRSEDIEGEEGWIRHAGGVMADKVETSSLHGLDGAWPPKGATPVPLDDLYERLGDVGLDYGPVFRGLRSAWRDGRDVYAEARLPEDLQTPAESFGIHPALLDAALHAATLAGEQPAEVQLPFAWSGVQLHAVGASSLRLRLSTDPQGTIVLATADDTGAPLLTAASLSTRAIAPEQLRSDAAGESLLGIEWTPLEVAASAAERSRESWALLGAEDSPLETVLRRTGAEFARHPEPAALSQSLHGQEGDGPSLVLLDASIPCGGGEEIAGVHSTLKRLLGTLQYWLSDERLSERRLAIVTSGAVATGATGVTGERIALDGAAVWGLVRSAQVESPERFVLIDVDGGELPVEQLVAALDAGEPQLAIRDGQLLLPRLKRVAAAETPAPAAELGDRSVLVTGGTGGLGAVVARHLVAERGVRSLVLASRRGPDAQGAAELREELAGMGADVQVLACDVTDRQALRQLVEGVSDLGGVVHAAGVLDDGVIGSLTPQSLERVLAPKADAAWHLHELTEGLDLAFFTLFSSAAACLGAPGQGNYAAANAFLDALAVHRRSRGLAANSIAWGYWDQASEMTGALEEADLARMSRAGVLPLSVEEGLRLLDVAQASPEAMVVAMRLDPAALRAQARSGLLPSLLSGLVRVPVRRAAGGGSLARRLAGVPQAERAAAVLDLVRGEVAVVLGHTAAASVDPDRAFKDLGFDSLTAVELRNRLSAVSGLRLPVTLVFDYPNSNLLARHLLELVGGVGERAGSAGERRAANSEELVAIVGMSCRYPGGVRSPEELWRLVAEGRDAIDGFPSNRGWELESLFDPDPDNPGTSYVREGGFLYDAGDFDAGFFGISPREAITMDPQQRLLLEASWEALEDAELDPSQLRGSQTGVFAGLMHHDYGTSSPQLAAGDLDGYIGTGISGGVLSGRVAYVLGLEGPAMTVDTACSSSLVTLHLACQALRSSECSLALAGGVTVLATPALFLEFSRQRGLSPDGRCKSFADAADGTGFAEGVGVLVLERLSDALQNGHRVMGVVRGSAVNQDGASNGLTAPNGPSQQRVIMQALASAGLGTEEVDAVEAHGTGTVLGDPIEAQALLATYGSERSEPLWLGSVKSNIGHTQAAAGVAGVIKMVKALEHGMLPPTLHVDEPSSHVDWSEGAVSLLREPQAWERNGRARRAGISSFGVSGTNAHVIVEEPPVLEGSSVRSDPSSLREQSSLPVLPWVLSARGADGLVGQAGRLRETLEANPSLDAGDVGLSLASKPALSDRAVLVGERQALLDGLATRFEPAGLLTGGLGVLFTGQGSQRVGMGRELHERFAVFRSAFEEACSAFDELLGRSLRDVVFEGCGGDLNGTDLAQPGLFAIELASLRLVESWGVKPDLLMGHSIGEIVAAHVGGVLSLPDACTLVAARGRLMGELSPGGGMASIAAGEEEVLDSLASFEGRAGVAAVNGPKSVVVSGEQEAVEELIAQWDQRGVKTKRLRVSHAFHSHLMDPMLDEFARVLEGLSYAQPQIAIVSNLTGEIASAEQLRSPEYWVRHVREPVRFMQGVAAMAERGIVHYLELGPDAVLNAMGRECLEDRPVAFGATMRRERPEVETLFVGVGELWERGMDVDWEAVLDGRGYGRVALPTYAFQRERFWLSSGGGAGDVRSVGQSSAEHPLLGAVVRLADGDGVVLTGRVSPGAQEWLSDHVVLGNVLFPGTGFLELALHAGETVGAPVVRELVLQAPLLLAGDGAVQIQVVVGDLGEDGSRRVGIYSRAEQTDDLDGGGWTRHAEGALCNDEVLGESLDGSWPPEGASEIDVEQLYDGLAEAGLEYGPVFQGLRSAWRLGDDVYAEVRLQEDQTGIAGSFGVHPALLDAALHGAALLYAQDSEQGVRLPFAWNGVRLDAVGARSLRVRLTADAQGAIALVAADDSGAPLLSAASLSTRAIAQDLGARAAKSDWLFEVDWQSWSGTPGQPGKLVVLGPHGPALPGAERFDDLAALARSLDEGGSAPTDALLDLRGLAVSQTGSGGESTDTAAQAREAVVGVLSVLQDWLADERLASSRLIVLSEGAVEARSGEGVPALAQSGVWGLVRSAQTENPERFALIDLDGQDDSSAALLAAAAAREPQIALRDGQALVPRLKRLPATEPAGFELDEGATVLVSGGTGGLGSVVARHLVAEHGVRSLVLTSRRGPEAPGASELREELIELGARVEIVACDVSDRDALQSLLGGIDGLSGVVHAAGALDDGVISTLGAQSVARVMEPKATAAWHLHELTAGLDLSFFALFSSAAACVGAPGQGNYAAANAFLDALAARRRSEGLPATSIAWGFWEQPSGMTGKLDESDISRMARQGVLPLTTEEGLRCFDVATSTLGPLTVAIHLDMGVLRSQARGGLLAPMFAGLVKASARRAADTGALARRLADLAEEDREGAVLEVVRAEVATVLGHSAPASIDPEKTFKDLGFDSLAAVELRNRLNLVTGLRLAATLVFDYPTSTAVTQLVLKELSQSTAISVDVEIDRLESTLASMASAGDTERARIVARLQALMSQLDMAERREDHVTVAEKIQSASADEVFEFIDKELESL